MPVPSVQSNIPSSSSTPAGEVVQNETVGQAQVGGQTDVQVVDSPDARPVDVVVRSSAEGVSISFKVDKSVMPPGSGGSQLESFIEQSGAKFAEQFGAAGEQAFGELAARISNNPQEFMTDGKLDINKIKDAVIGTAVALGRTEVQSLEFVNQERADLLRDAPAPQSPPSGPAGGNSTRMGSTGGTTPTTGGNNTRMGSTGGTTPTTGGNNTRMGSTGDNTTNRSGGPNNRLVSDPTGDSGPQRMGSTNTTTVSQSTSWAVLGDIQGGDIEAMCFLVLMQAAKSAQEDLKAIMAKVKAINNAKAQQRKNLSAAQTAQALCSSKTAGQSLSGISGFDPAAKYGKAELDHSPDNPQGFNNNVNGYGLPQGDGRPKKSDMDAMVETMRSDLDSMSEMGEMESLRLQMAMDRLSKMMSTLSNLLKKISDTSQSITQNLK